MTRQRPCTALFTILALCAGLCSLGCSAATAEPPVAPQSAGTGALPELRSLAGWEPVDVHVQLHGGHNYISDRDYCKQSGATEYELLVDVVFDGETFNSVFEDMLGLEPAESALSYAMWGFKDSGLYPPQSVAVHGSGSFEAGSGYYLAFSNYAYGRWELLGPFDNPGESIAIDYEDYSTAMGYSYLAVIVGGEDSLEISELTLQCRTPEH